MDPFAMPRFYVPVPLHLEQNLRLKGAVARHIQVLRLQPGQMVQLFNGQGGAYATQIVAMERKAVQVQVLEFDPSEREASRCVHLFVGVPANDRMDWLVEKATELGVASIHPMLTEHCILRLSDERAQKRRDHWQAIAAAACEQSGRNRIPNIALPAPLATCIPKAQGLRLCLSLSPLANTFNTTHCAEVVNVFSGPEGGLSANEEAQLVQANTIQIRLCERTLRSETAPLAALTLLALSFY